MSKFREYLGIPELPPVVPHWKFPARMVQAVSKILDYLETAPLATNKSLHVYADGTNGSDGNDGLSPSKPKKTLQAVFGLVPDTVKHNTTVHLSGNFVNMGAVWVQKNVVAGVSFLVDGGSSLTIIDDNSGSNYTATASATSSITDSSATWSTDEHAGYIVEVLSGPAQGEKRLIHGNTATAITPCTYFDSDPGVGATFRIVRPSTTFSGSTSQTFNLRVNGGGETYIQRLYLSGSEARIWVRNSQTVRPAFIVSDSTKSDSLYFQWSQFISISSAALDPSTFSSDADWEGGVSVRSTSSALSFNSVGDIQIRSSYVRELSVVSSNIALIGFGCRFTGGGPCVVFENCTMESLGFIDAGTTTTKIDSSTGIGMQITDSRISVTTAIDLPSNTSHGIQVNGGMLRMKAAVSGSGNGGAGVHGKNGATVLITDGAAPTITGTAGDFSVNGTSQKSTWAAIDGGTPAIEATNDLVVAKEA